MKYYHILLLFSIIIPVLFVWLFYPAAVALRNQQNPLYDAFSIISSDYPSSDIDMSIVFPAYNEEARLSSTLDSTYNYIKNINAFNLKYEIIIVDDGSDDKTVEVAKQYMKQHDNVPMKVIMLAKNRGKGGAVKLGVHHALGKYILMADADGATDINDLTKLYSQLQHILPYERDATNKPHLGIAIGSRAHLEKDSISSRAFYRTILMHGFHLLVNLMCTHAIRDTQCGFKLFTHHTAHHLFHHLHLDRWAFDIELIYMAEMLQVPMVEVAVTWTEVPGSKLIRSKLDVITTSLEMARDIVCIRLAYMVGIWELPTAIW